MIAKIRREWIWFPVRKDQCADSVEESARDEQGDGSHAKLGINGTDQKNDDPSHQQKADIGHPDRNLAKKIDLSVMKKIARLQMMPNKTQPVAPLKIVKQNGV